MGLNKAAINPATGKAYAINPATGNWDDNYFATVVEPSMGGGGSDPYASMRGPNFADFKFDYPAAEQQALVKLAPYYKQMLDLNNGDVERAKQMIEADYVSGKRQRTSQYSGDVQSENASAQDEMSATKDDLNKRGVLFQENAPGQAPAQPHPSGVDEQTAAPEAQDSGAQFQKPLTQTSPTGMGYSNLATTNYFDPLLDKQQARRNAIQRAITNQSDMATNQYTKDKGDTISRGLSSNLQLDQEKQDKALQMSQNAYTVARNQYEAGTGSSQINPYLQK